MRQVLVLVLVAGCGGGAELAERTEAAHTPVLELQVAPAVDTSHLLDLRALTIADIDVDGNNDAVGLWVNPSGQAVLQVLFGNGDGTLSLPVASGAGQDRGPFALGDFDGDGYLDAATTADALDRITIRRGAGDGTFQAGTTIVVGGSIGRAVARDLDGDRFDDLVLTDSAGAALVVLHSIAGTLSPVRYPVAAAPGDLVIADLNGDGAPDLAASLPTAGVVAVLLGRGNGSFRAAHTYDAGPAPGALAAADVDGNGTIDLVVAAADLNGARVLRGRGNGTFRLPVATTLGRSIRAWFPLGDSDGDGTGDLAAQTELGLTTVHGRRSGGLRVAADYQGGAVAASGYLDGDATVDLLAASGGAGEFQPGFVATLLGTARGTFRAARRFSAGAQPDALIGGDFDGDGFDDVAVTARADDLLHVFLGTPGRGLVAASTQPAGVTPISITTADFDEDGALDLAIAFAGSADVRLMLGNGDGTFQAAVAVGGFVDPTRVIAGDLDGDGHADLAVATAGGVQVAFGAGNASFGAPVDTGVGATGFALGDFEDNGRLDVAVPGAGVVRVARTLAGRTFAPPLDSPGPEFGLALATGDFDGDGRLDVAVSRVTFGPSGALYNVTLLRGGGNGTFGLALGTGNDVEGGIQLAAADFDGDGIDDLATGSLTRIDLLRGGARVDLVHRYRWNAFPGALATGDTDGDGRPDLLVLDSALAWLRNLSR